MSKGYHKPKSLERRQKNYDADNLATKGKGFRRPGSNKKG